MMKLPDKITSIELPIQRRQPAHSPWRMRWMVVAGTAGGATLMYFADPSHGRRRRAIARDRSAGIARHTGRRAGRSAKKLKATVSGQAKGLRHTFSSPVPVANDQMLTDRVKSQAFRDPGIDRSRVNLNVEDGIVVLHGVIDDQNRIDELTDAVRRVPGVRDVTSYLHTPDLPAPMEGPRHFENGAPDQLHHD
jgi:hypothetical protein